MNSVCTLCCDGCKEHGERVERDRIIKLLHGVFERVYPLKYDYPASNAILEAIALIKEENK